MRALELASSLFAHAVAGGADVATLGEADLGLGAHLERELSTPGALEQARLLCALPRADVAGARLDALPAGSLVRFRGMVQDMFDPEYYVGAWRLPGEPWRTTKYSDGAAVPGDAETAVWERRVFFCVPVPGEAPWASGDGGSAAAGGAATSPAAGGRSDKRRRPGEAEDASMDSDVSLPTPEESPASADSKRTRAHPDAAAPAAQPADPAAAATLPGGVTGGFILKVYGSGADSVRLHDVLDCVCVLAVAPEEAALFGGGFGGGEAGEFPEEEAARHPPHSAVPRLHALLVAHAPPPGAPPQGEEAAAAAVRAAALAAAAPALRAQCIELLTASLGGDALAAEYLLLHLLSRVHARAEPMAVGAMSLNLRGLGGGRDESAACAAADIVAATVATLAPRCLCRAVSVEALNAASWSPRKDYTSGRLGSTVLQLAAGTHLVLDETRLQAGTLCATGLQNVQALKQLMSEQKIDVDFQYYSTPLTVDHPVLVLSQFKSILSADVAVPLHATAAPRPPPPADEPALAPLRAFLAAARALPHGIAPDVGAEVEADLVAARAADPTLGQEVFHRWLTLGRLMAASAGESSLSSAAWRRVREMEHVVAERIRAEQ